MAAFTNRMVEIKCFRAPGSQAVLLRLKIVKESTYGPMF